MADPAPTSDAPAVPEESGTRTGPAAWRKPVAWVCLALAFVLLLASALSVWAKRQALDSERWADTSVELLQNQEIRDSLGVYIADQLFQKVDVPDRLAEALPPAAARLAAPLAGSLQTGAENLATRILSQPQAQAVWKEANLRAHRRLLAVVEGEDVPNRLIQGQQGGEVVLDLNPFVTRAATALGVEDRVTPDAGRLVILKSDQLESAQTAVSVIRKLSLYLWIAVVGLFVAAIWLAPGFRRTMVMVTGWGIIGIGLLILIARRLTGNAVVNALSGDSAYEPSELAAWFIGTSLLRDLAIAMIAVGILLVVWAWVSGPGRWAVAVRRWLAPQFRARTWAVFGIVVVLLLLAFVLGPGAGGSTLLGTLIFVVLVLVGLWALRRQTLQEFPEEASPPPVVAPPAGAA